MRNKIWKTVVLIVMASGWLVVVQAVEASARGSTYGCCF
jgi:hypothetical protein